MGDAEGLEALGRAAGGEGLDGDGVAGVDGEDWRGFCGVVAPGYGGGGGEEGLGGCWALAGDGEECSGAQGGEAGWVGGHGFYISRRLVLPDGPTARGAATSWRVYLFLLR